MMYFFLELTFHAPQILKTKFKREEFVDEEEACQTRNLLNRIAELWYLMFDFLNFFVSFN